ncbi:hypothetical protein BC941DRAFT_335235, partial [Chlamydoabsidia padenii]
RALVALPSAIARPSSESYPVLQRTWKIFWSWSMPAPLRTLWFRFFHRTLPTRWKLHHRLPEVFSSPLCIICFVNVDYDYHFLFSCPIKSIFWRSFFQEFFEIPSTTFMLGSIFNDIMISLRFPPLKPYFAQFLYPYKVFLCGLKSMWQAHWRLVYDNHPL